MPGYGTTIQKKSSTTEVPKQLPQLQWQIKLIVPSDVKKKG